MKEQKRVFEAVKKARAENRQSVLATVVRVSGSAYRREGAKMLIEENSDLTGMISGGCLESDVAETVKQVFQTGKSMYKSYVMDEDLVWGLGLGCPGTVHLFMELVPAEEDTELNAPFSAWMDCILKEKEAIMATIIEEGEPSRQLFLQKDDTTMGTLDDDQLEQQVRKAAAQKFTELNPKPETVQYSNSDGHTVEIFIDMYQPPLSLVIFGAGHDAIPVARYGVSIGMKTTVVDQRPYYNSEERFPGTERIITTPSNFADKVHMDKRTYAIVMNHHIEKDQDTLKFILPSNAFYIGVLGPRKRRMKMIEAIKEEGFEFNKSQLERMHSPVGLNIGAVTPEEIAISILSEIIAVSKGHSGGFLRGSELIHEAATS